MRQISRTDRTPRHYARKFTISQHATDRFRERVDEEFRHRDDEDLGHLLDEKMRHCGERHRVKDPRAPDATTFLFTIETRDNGVFYVVVRDETAITVLDPDMARRNFPTTWAPIAINTPFRALQGLKIVGKTQPLVKDIGPAQPLVDPAQVATALGYVPASPLDDLGAKYARARKRRRECETELATARRIVELAEIALADATAVCAQAERDLDAATE